MKISGKNSIKFLLSIILLLPLYINAQTQLEGGPFIGVSWYNGDLNHQRQFYNIHPAYGGIIRYIVNDRIAFRGALTMATISGSYPEKNIYLPETNENPYQFKRNVGDASVLLEINFFSFDNPKNKESIFTPYVALGLASTFYNRFTEEEGNYSEKPTFVLSLPFGAGVKWKVNDRIRMGADWTFRKTFVDDLDFVGREYPVNPSDPFGFGPPKGIHNNDWYSVVGIYVTFSLLTRQEKCHAGF
jgi:hypothetical protein